MKSKTMIHAVRPCAAASMACVALAFGLGGCSSTPDSIVDGPLTAAPLQRPQNVERLNNGAIYQAGATTSLFTGEQRPRNVGDTLKVDISEILYASNKANGETSKESKLVNKGPGSKAGLGLISSIMNIDATANGSTTFKGSGTADSSSKFTGQIAVTVINALPNGNLVIAGERSLGLHGDVTTLRFSGIVNPRDIKSGNLVASSDTVNAKLEVAGTGEVSAAASRSWVQRVLVDSLSYW